MLTETSIETNIVAVERPASGVLLVEEIVVREASTKAIGGAEGGLVIDQPEQKVA
jgi:hypothetical protein